MGEKEVFNKKFGQFVKQMRVNRNWKQVELADLLNNNFQNISRLERGEITPTLYWSNKLAKAFSLSLSELIISFEKFEMK